MKKLLFNTSFLAVSVFMIMTAVAQNDNNDKRTEPKFSKSKNYTKSYSLGSGDKVKLFNQFGDMKVVTWDRKEVKVDVSIVTKSDEEDRAQRLLDNISIEDEKDSNTISFKTKFDNKNNKEESKDGSRKARHEEMHIDYVVSLPSSTTLNAQNQFGKLTVPDYRGEVELVSEFGALITGQLGNAKKVTASFGSANIEEVDGGEVDIKYGTGEIKKLGGEISLNIEFSQAKVNLGNDIKNLNIRNSYSTVYLDLDKNLSATYDVSSSYGEFTNKTSFAIKEKDEQGNSHARGMDRRYSGTSGSGSAKINISSSFGETVAGHDLKVDLKKGGKRV